MPKYRFSPEVPQGFTVKNFRKCLKILLMAASQTSIANNFYIASY